MRKNLAPLFTALSMAVCTPALAKDVDCNSFDGSKEDYVAYLVNQGYRTYTMSGPFLSVYRDEEECKVNKFAHRVAVIQALTDRENSEDVPVLTLRQ